ncbi:hypothetical protein LOAG_08987 [Loa loa]|uniref:Uncharacterized protein n=1 Tax=Loa loa TaxID=7209 RepID=A0A1S0TSK0_LOALO|nr:hypothetical protein LOAG_08987 [Loa loa]EFO19503.1 hypothetical protein LOAG_08987 [Loa loa]
MAIVTPPVLSPSRKPDLLIIIPHRRICYCVMRYVVDVYIYVYMYVSYPASSLSSISAVCEKNGDSVENYCNRLSPTWDDSPIDANIIIVIVVPTGPNESKDSTGPFGSFIFIFFWS